MRISESFSGEVEEGFLKAIRKRIRSRCASDVEYAEEVYMFLYTWDIYNDDCPVGFDTEEDCDSFFDMNTNWIVEACNDFSKNNSAMNYFIDVVIGLRFTVPSEYQLMRFFGGGSENALDAKWTMVLFHNLLRDCIGMDGLEGNYLEILRDAGMVDKEWNEPIKGSGWSDAEEALLF